MCVMKHQYCSDAGRQPIVAHCRRHIMAGNSNDCGSRGRIDLPGYYERDRRWFCKKSDILKLNTDTAGHRVGGVVLPEFSGVIDGDAERIVGHHRQAEPGQQAVLFNIAGVG